MNLHFDAALAGLAAVAAVAGILIAATGVMGWANRPARRRSRARQRLRAALGAGNSPGPVAWWARAGTRVTGAIVAGLVVWLFSRWPVGGLLTAVVIVALPWLLNPGGNTTREVTRLEAVEEWVRRLSDIHTVGVSLEQSIQRSLQTVPAPIRDEVTSLVARMSAGWHPADAYRAFADELDDATADEVVALMILHVEDRGAGLSRALNELASGLSHEVLSRREIEAERQKPRTNDRWVTGFCLVIFGLSMLSPAWAVPYSTAMGQLVLIVLVAAFVVVKIWMRRMAIVEPTSRFLTAQDHAGGNTTIRESA